VAICFNDFQCILYPLYPATVLYLSHIFGMVEITIVVLGRRNPQALRLEGVATSELHVHRRSGNHRVEPLRVAREADLDLVKSLATIFGFGY
jgi:hypothetical protein